MNELNIGICDTLLLTLPILLQRMKLNNYLWSMVTDAYKRYANEKGLNKYSLVNAMPDLPREEEMITKEIKACILSDDVCDEMDECNHDGGEEAM